MTKTIAGGALALALLGGAALLPAPASANSIHDNGDFGGTWSRIGPSEAHGRRDTFFGRYGPRDWGLGYYGRPYAYYGPSYHDRDYAPGPDYSGPGIDTGL
jgi:hypothetical protein